MTTATMKAVVLRAFGSADVLRLEDVPRPTPRPDEVLVRVHAVSVNRSLDLGVRAGQRRSRISLPLVLGVDPSGVVAETGADVSDLAVGDRVAVASSIRCQVCRWCVAGDEADCPNGVRIGVDRWGGYAEYVAVPARNAYRIPDAVSFAEATVVMRHFPTAFHLLELAQLRAGEWLLVMGAAGALGSCGVQVGKLLGATVVAGAGASDRVAATRQYGADHGVNYRAADLAAEVERVTDGRGVDVVFENIGDPELWPRAFASLARGGRLVTAGAHAGGVVGLDVRRLYNRRLTVIGGAGANRRDIDRSFAAAASGEIRAIIGRVMPLAIAAEAHRWAEDRHSIGKVILDPTLS